jgi:mono/diheme cytochrome c family protein
MRAAVARIPRRLRGPLALIAGASLLAGLAGCEAKQGTPDMVNGKKLFVGKCGSCHILARANAKGTTGPNLDQAFNRALHDGFKRDTIETVVEKQILYPNINGVMPAKLVTGRDASDVAAYVAYATNRKGQDTGALATAVGGAQKPLAQAKNGVLEIPADPNGQLLFTFKNAQAPPGPLDVRSPNKSAVQHDIAIQGNGVNAKGAVGANGHVSEFKVTLKAGKYPFLCTVPGHAQAGMKGTLTVK